MSEYQGNHDSIKPPSYPLTGSAPPMGENDYFALKPTPEGMEPIVDPNTKMCIGYMKISIGYDPTSGFLKYVFIYDVNEKEVDHYKLTLTAEDVNAMSPEALEEYRKFRRSVFDAEDHGMFGSSDDVWFMVATDGLFSDVSVTHAIAQYVSSRISTATTFVLKAKLKMGLSPSKLKFYDAASTHMFQEVRRVSTTMLEHSIRYGKRLPDPADEFGGMFKMYDIVMYKNKEQFILEVLVDEKTWTIKHFNYISARKFGDQLSQRAKRYRKVFPNVPYIKRPIDHVRALREKNKKMKDIYYSRSKIGKRDDVVNSITQHYEGKVYYPGKSKSKTPTADEVSINKDRSGNKQVMRRSKGNKRYWRSKGK